MPAGSTSAGSLQAALEAGWRRLGTSSGVNQPGSRTAGRPATPASAQPQRAHRHCAAQHPESPAHVCTHQPRAPPPRLRQRPRTGSSPAPAMGSLATNYWSAPAGWGARRSSQALGLGQDTVQLAPVLATDTTAAGGRIIPRPDSEGTWVPIIMVHGWASQDTNTNARTGAAALGRASRCPSRCTCVREGDGLRPTRCHRRVRCAWAAWSRSPWSW